MSNLKIGMFGLGRIGLVFAETLLSMSKSVQLIAYSPAKRKRFAHLHSHPNFQFCADLKEMFAADFSGYIVASPSDTHYDYLKKLVPKGKPIFCEKPIDLRADKIARVATLAADHKVPVLVGFNRRFDPQVQSIKQSLQGGKIGDLHLLRLTSRDPNPPSLAFARSSGGLFLDMSIHDFDMLRFLTGSEPVSIFCKASLRSVPQFAAIGDVDTALTTVTMADGTLVSIDNSRRTAYGYDQRIEAFGSKGMVQMNNQRHDETQLYSKNGQQAKPLKNFFMDRYAESYRREMEHLIELIGNPDTISPAVDVHDALIATKIAVAASKSRKTGREVYL